MNWRERERERELVIVTVNETYRKWTDICKYKLDFLQKYIIPVSFEAAAACLQPKIPDANSANSTSHMKNVSRSAINLYKIQYIVATKNAPKSAAMPPGGPPSPIYVEYSFCWRKCTFYSCLSKGHNDEILADCLFVCFFFLRSQLIWWILKKIKTKFNFVILKEWFAFSHPRFGFKIIFPLGCV